jgi:hypothetical protein
LNNLTVVVWKNEKDEIILETLLNNELDKNRGGSEQKIFIHGYFTQVPPSSAPGETPEDIKLSKVIIPPA